MLYSLKGTIDLSLSLILKTLCVRFFFRSSRWNISLALLHWIENFIEFFFPFVLSVVSITFYLYFFLCLFGFCLLVGPKCRTDANKVSNSWSKLNKWLTKHMYLREYEYVCLFLFLFLNLVHIFVTIVNIKWYYINFYRIRFEYSTKKKSIVFLQTYNKKCVCVLVLA